VKKVEEGMLRDRCSEDIEIEGGGALHESGSLVGNGGEHNVLVVFQCVVGEVQSQPVLHGVTVAAVKGGDKDKRSVSLIRDV
jgi:hypothetical protein